MQATKTQPDTNICVKVRELVQDRTISELAEAFGVSRQTWHKWASGEHEIPKASRLIMEMILENKPRGIKKRIFGQQ